MKLTKPYRLKDYKFSLVITVLILAVFGIMMIGSAKESVQVRQIIGLVVAVIAMVVVSLIDYVWILKLHWLIYGGNILLLLAVRLFGDNVNGAQRWIDLGFTTLQPSEISKILMVLFYAKFIMDHEEDINTPKTIITALLLAAPPLILILKQPDLSTTISITAVFCILMFVGGIHYKLIGIILAVAIPAAIIFISIAVQPNQKLLDEYQQKRILAWLEPEKYATDEGYQQQNSEMAIGSGQLRGKGYKNNTTTSVKNGNFILEPQTDFIFAIIGEELGFVGCCTTIALLLLVVILCIMIGVRAQDFAGQLVCCGIAAQIGIQSFINIGVATALLPNTGIPLPFISYGLSSLVSMFIGIGIVLNIGLQPKKYQ